MSGKTLKITSFSDIQLLQVSKVLIDMHPMLRTQVGDFNKAMVEFMAKVWEDAAQVIDAERQYLEAARDNHNHPPRNAIVVCTDLIDRFMNHAGHLRESAKKDVQANDSNPK